MHKRGVSAENGKAQSFHVSGDGARTDTTTIAEPQIKVSDGDTLVFSQLVTGTSSGENFSSACDGQDMTVLGGAPAPGLLGWSKSRSKSILRRSREPARSGSAADSPSTVRSRRSLRRVQKNAVGLACPDVVRVPVQFQHRKRSLEGVRTERWRSPPPR